MEFRAMKAREASRRPLYGSRCHTPRLEYIAGSDTAYVVANLIAARSSLVAVVIDPRSPAATLLAPLEALDVLVTEPATRDVALAHGLFLDDSSLDGSGPRPRGVVGRGSSTWRGRWPVVRRWNITRSRLARVSDDCCRASGVGAAAFPGDPGTSGVVVGKDGLANQQRTFVSFWGGPR